MKVTELVSIRANTGPQDSQHLIQCLLFPLDHDDLGEVDVLNCQISSENDFYLICSTYDNIA